MEQRSVALVAAAVIGDDVPDERLRELVVDRYELVAPRTSRSLAANASG